MAIPLAHSARDGVSAQGYFQHVTNVQKRAVANAESAAAFNPGIQRRFVAWVKAASLMHDLGKLDELNQAVLRSGRRVALPVPHEDAGVAALWQQKSKESAVLVAAHHAGLFSKSAERYPGKRRPFRNEKTLEVLKGAAVDSHVDQSVCDYLAIHVRAGLSCLDETTEGGLNRCGFTRRVALSCLVDADHSDTARHYGREVPTTDIATRWEERAAALQRYVDRLPEGKGERERRRNELRRRVYDACRDAPVNPAMRACDAPVGSGKTTAVIAHLLRVAREKRLRHIFVVLPYTNIITQSVAVYRNALVLEGERPEDVVVEHHHRADFENVELRQLATLWKAPIIVTTAVQFVETLGSHHPARLRKLHELPGSAVFLDETHAAMPSHLWPQTWRWLETWTRDWGGHIVLASGSLPRFWELDEYRQLIRGPSTDPMPAVPDLVTDATLKDEAKEMEQQRVRFRRPARNARALDCDGLIQLVSDKPGPRLLVVNTVQTAAVVALAMRERGCSVVHLSTALAPAHRDLVVERVKLRLRDMFEDWTLVATSCVEAGMDLSFRSGFRERASTASLIQISGRVSRSSEHDDAEVWDLLLRDDRFRHNPALKVPRQALDRFSEAELNHCDQVELATLAMRREWTSGAEGEARKLLHDEEHMEYRPVGPPNNRRGVGHLCRIIDSDTRTVVIDQEIADAIRNGRSVSNTDLLRYSVQMWATKIQHLGLESIGYSDELYAWGGMYDPDFLGYMAGVLQIHEFVRIGGAVI